MNGILPLGIFRTASGIAREAIDSLGQTATSFAAALNVEPTVADPTNAEPAVSETRVKLVTAIEAVLDRMGIAKDPALAFVANDDGTLELDGDHDRAAEINTNLRDDGAVQGLTSQLLRTASGADRRMVLHAVAVV